VAHLLEQYCAYQSPMQSCRSLQPISIYYTCYSNIGINERATLQIEQNQAFGIKDTLLKHLRKRRSAYNLNFYI